MIIANTIEKKLLIEGRKVSIHEPSKLLAEFFNGEIIELDQEYENDS